MSIFTADNKKLIAAIIISLWFFTMGSASFNYPNQISTLATFTVDPNFISPTPTKAPMSAENLIKLVNQARMGHHLPALIVDPILMQTAQTTADIMAGNLMTGHIGDVKSRIMAAGYGIGDIPWGTENFVVLPLGAESQIMRAWADDTHQIPMVNPNYRHVGAGVAVVDDTVYYVLHAAYTSNKIYEPAGLDGKNSAPVKNLVSQYIYAVQTVTPAPDGRVIHIVKNGQSLWAIAIAYNVRIEEIKNANNMPQSLEMVYEGQQLIIPKPIAAMPTTKATPTLTQMVVFTETPTRAVQAVESATQLIEGTATAIPVSEEDDVEDQNPTNNIIFYSIGGAIILGLVLIIVGAITGNKKGRGF